MALQLVFLLMLFKKLRLKAYNFVCLSLAVHEKQQGFRVNSCRYRADSLLVPYYDLEGVKGTLSLCIIEHSTVEEYYELDVQTHLFLTTILDRAVPLNTTSDSSLLPKINASTFCIWGMVESGGWRDWTGESFPSNLVVKKMFKYI